MKTKSVLYRARATSKLMAIQYLKAATKKKTNNNNMKK